MNTPQKSDEHRISLETAVAMTSRLRSQDQKRLPISETFDRTAFDRLLAQPGCAALRIYYGMDEAMQTRAIIVGVDEKNEDILPTPENPAGEIVDISKLCPPFCAPASPLNPG